MAERIVAVVVTRNRCALLKNCLENLSRQTRPPDLLLVIDNASSDGTARFLDAKCAEGRIHRVRSEENLGGAGGFALGIAAAIEQGFDWIWLMDDDAMPCADALSRVLEFAHNQENIYCSSAVAESAGGKALCWPATPSAKANWPRMIFQHDELPPVVEVDNVPFLGFLVHRSLVTKIGLPDSSYFISGDDAEYCARARRQGARIFLVKASQVVHPLPSRRAVSLLGRNIVLLDIPPWKRYYEVRNRLLTARRHYGWRLWTETLPGTLFRWTVTRATDTDRTQSRAFSMGLRDGLLGRSGKCWSPEGEGRHP
jgi:rhamnopyranosyl-N-acetylglucosaminyl-diphospho-decaprenol beta-1,3/1,4-galactofuranosyltransferase